MAKNEKHGQTEVATTEPKRLAKDELRKLFASYDTAHKAVTEHQAALDKAKAARSNVVKAICEGTGSKGPFNRSGVLLSGVERKNKETGESNWFFKGPGVADAIDV